MSRAKLRRAENDLYSRHPKRIAEALELHELYYDAYAVLSFLVDKIEAPGSNGRVVFTLKGLAEALRWPHSLEWLRQKLQELRRQGWITIELRMGPQAPWIFRLSGAAIDAERDESPTSLQLEGPSELETNSNSEGDSQSANPQPNGVSESRESPTAESPRAEQSRAETENLCSEEGTKHHVVGKTTAGEPSETDRLIAKVEALGRRDNGRPVSVEQVHDGSLVWSGEPQEGEQALLDDFQALVDAGLGEWRENDDGGES